MSGGQSPTTADGGHSLFSADDRALLLPQSPSIKPDVRAAAVKTEGEKQAKKSSSLVDADCEVYTITDDSLPPHMRSLLPSHERQVHDLLTLERTRQRLRYVIAGLSLMLALTVVVAVALVLSLKVARHEGGQGRFRGSSSSGGSGQGKELTTEIKLSPLEDQKAEKTARNHGGVARGMRAPCVKECWTYAAFRFKSVCDEEGYCLCGGDNYDPYTCLPTYNDCNIEKRLPAQSPAKLFGKNQTTYVCHVPPSSRDEHESVHVVSIFGNHRADTTHVTIQGPSPSRKKVLVLVNYHYVQWTVHLPEKSGITKVVIVSMKRSNQAKNIIFLSSSSSPSSENNHPDAELTHRLSLTGYGEDQHGGHTPRLLQFINDRVGPVASFLGASHAEEIFLDLSFESSMNTTTANTTATGESGGEESSTDENP